MAEKRVWRYGASRYLFGRSDGVRQKGAGVVQSVEIDQTALRYSSNASNVERIGTWKALQQIILFYENLGGLKEMRTRDQEAEEDCRSCDDVVPYKFGEKSSSVLSSTGFQDATFKVFNGLGHYTIPEEMNEVCAWLTSKLGLEGRSS
ncbi:unnamed protein product [Dovyalis caffra]|uniref:Uncharacterized protein n=1 Tax=Dovyalis caffra TaxID=77055 RepID=A0AAV1RGR4_9ROSI|nr:unnamed protein product [Dovyalis caffra]